MTVLLQFYDNEFNKFSKIDLAQNIPQ